MTAYATIASLRAYLPQVPEYGLQLLTPTAYPFTLTYEGVSTGNLASGATATAVQTALRSITAIGSSGVNVRGKPSGPYTATFQGTLATDAALMTATNATVVPATDSVLQDCLDRATDIVRSAMRSLLADPDFDYTAYAVASTKIVRGYDAIRLRLPPYQLGSVTLVEYQSSSNPSAYTTLSSDQWEAQSDGRLYRAFTWGGGIWGADPRYRITAVWGYGPTPPDALAQLVLELAVNIWRSRDKGGFTEIVGVNGSGGIKQIAGLNAQQQMTWENLRNQLLVIGV
jgi:hypothetical protein